MHWYCCSVAEPCLPLCNSMNSSTPGFLVLHYLLEFAQTHVHWDIQPSHSLLPTSPPAPNLSQHQGLLQWAGSLHQVAKVLELQHQSFQWIFRVDFLSDSLIWSPCCPRDSQESSPEPQFKASILWCSAFFMVQLSHPYMTTGEMISLTIWTFVRKVVSLLLTLCLGSS